MRREDIESIFPLSPAQQGMLYYLVLSSEPSDAFFEQYTCLLTGDPDPELWRRAWQRVIDRHAALRSFFLWERRERPLQVVVRRLEPEWHEEDWSDLPATERERRLAGWLAGDRRHGLRLDEAPLVRFALFREPAGALRFAWTFSHLQVDGWSMALVLREVSEIYLALAAGAEPELAPARSYRDYVAWLEGQDMDAAHDFWRRALDGVSGALRLAIDRRRPSDRHAVAGERRRELPAALVARLQELGQREGLTLNVLCQGAWSLLLSRLSGGDDVVYGAVASGRPPALEGVESIVGLFTNALPTRVRTRRRQALLPWLRELQLTLVAQREYEHAQLEEIRRALGLAHDEPLFDTLFVFENYPGREVTGRGLDVREARLEEKTHYPLVLYAVPGKGLVVRAVYDRGRFAAADVERLLAVFERLLAGFVERPEGRLGSFSLLSGAAEREVLDLGAPPPECRGGRPRRPLPELIAERARATPAAAAVEAGGERLTYAELEAAANRLAHHLRRRGVGPDVLVGLALERTPARVVGLLGILKAGGAYLPLDPDEPASRLAFMLRDSGARLLVTEEALRDRFPEAAAVAAVDGDAVAAESDADPGPGAGPENLAYVIYTSGSTGRPKGVGIPHRAIVAYCEDARRAYGLEAGDRALQFASLSFDTSAEEIYPCLLAGATLVLRDDAMLVSSAEFLRRLGELGITVLNLPTAFWHQLAADLGGGVTLPGALRLVIIGGEAASGERLERWRQAGGTVRLVNTYGPTESTIVATRCDLDAELPAGPPPIGRAIGPARVRLLDAALQPVPAGWPGEILIGGAGVARGYLGRPRLSAQRFLPDPWSAAPGARLYRTGDLGRWRGDGRLEFGGRIDQQVKVRGFRIEPGEVEAALVRHPEVRDAVVVAREYGDDDLRLVAYVVGAAGDPPGSGALRSFLRRELPDYMMPAAFAALAELPLGAGGKVDRKALPDPDRARPDLADDYVAPRTPTEEMLAQLWSELLGVEQPGVHDDFFQLGGHSLLVGRLTNRLRKALGLELPLVSVFEHPTIAELAERVEELVRGMEAGEEQEAQTVELPPIVRVPRDGPLPLSYPQERVWFLKQLDPSSIAYNFQMTVTFRGPLEPAVLRAALTEIVRRHEVFHCVFPEVDGRPVMEVVGPWEAALPLVDLSRLEPQWRQEEAERLVRQETAWIFDPARLPLIRWLLVRLAPGLHTMIQVEFHFVHDGWSIGLFLRELKAIYTAFREGRPSPLPELEVQYGDFAAWQRRHVASDYVGALLEHWKRRLEGMPTVLDLPTDFRRPNRPSNRGRSIMLYLPDDVYHDLRELCRERGYTLYMAMLTAFYALLYRYTGQRDIAVGAAVANRRQREQESIIGMMVNTVVLRGDLSGEVTFEELLRRVRDFTLDAFAHQDMPFERLVQELDPERDLGRNPIFQVMFSFHDAPMPQLRFAGLEASYLVRTNLSSKADLSVIVAPQAEQKVGQSEARHARHRAVVTWEYDTALFAEATVRRIIEHYHALLRELVADPSRKLAAAAMMSAAERRRLVVDWNATDAPYPRHRGLHELFAERAAATPEAEALVAGGERLTYGELAARVHRLAHRLLELGLEREQLVGVCTDRSPHLVVALLAVLEAGGAYLPIDPAFPRQRVAMMLEDTGAPFILTLDALAPTLPERGARTVVLDREPSDDYPATAPPVAAVPESLAYVLHTSGSTGRPKGVAVSHRALVNFLAAMAREPGLEARDTLLAVTTISFDIAGLELYLPLTVGARVVVADRETAADGDALMALLASSGASVMQATPTTWQVLFAAGWTGEPRLKVLCGGEALPPELGHRLRASCGEVWNLYGPTETTIWSTLRRLAAGDHRATSVPIGRPIANTRLYVADRAGEPTAIGVPGELLIGGDGLARGYLGGPARTAERFRPDPFGPRPGRRLYATGDLVRYLPDATLTFLGRRDHQVKVRGFRIELGEIETALDRHPAVARAVAVTRPDPAGTPRLLAYYVGNGAGEPAAAGELREHLRRQLPEYMVPAAFIPLEAFPLTPNGKVDRAALARDARFAPDAALLSGEPSVGPRTPLEEELQGMWHEVLGREGIGVHDSFFDLGGHSLLATRVIARLARAYGVRLSLVELFEHPTLAGLAELLTARLAAEGEHGGEERIRATAEPDAAELAARAAEMDDADLDALLGTLMEEERG